LRSIASACSRPGSRTAPAGTEVAFYTIEGGGHAWPGEDRAPLAFRHAGNTPRDFDAGAVIWDFFQRHAKR
jgi:polyhydroxybutyrate depolymerase